MIIPKGCRITLDEYMKALKDMVSRDNPCVYCPGAMALINKNVIGVNDDFEQGEEPECVLCRTSAGCSPEYEGIRKSCPCYMLGQEEAIAGAFSMVEKWEREILFKKF